MKSKISFLAALALGALGLSASPVQAGHWHGGYGGYHCAPVYRVQHCAPVYRTYCGPRYYNGGYHHYRPAYRYYARPYRTAYYGAGYGYPYRSGYYGGYAAYPALSFGINFGGHGHHHGYGHRGYGHRGYCR